MPKGQSYLTSVWIKNYPELTLDNEEVFCKPCGKTTRFKMLVPTEALAHVKCSACYKSLSHFPIYVNENAQSIICGRCSAFLPIDENYVRNTLYESMAQFLKFPCIYNSEGCVENLLPCDVPNHEKLCPYRVISCALDCVWQGTLSDLLEHVTEAHPNILLRNGEFEVDILNSYEIFSFLIHNDEIFCFKRKYDSMDKVLQCSLSCYKTLESVTKYSYEITVCNGTRNLSVKFPLKSAENFQEENVTEISIDTIKAKLDDPSIIIGSVKIFIDEPKIPKPVKNPNSEINFAMLAELECPVCFDYIIPPIYQCVTGHSICADCKSKVAQCPTCEGEIKNTQNFIVEKMAYLLTYPCKFAEYGCEFASKPAQIKQHQKYCLHGPQECPLKEYENCNWKSTTKNIYSHVIKEHHDNILEIDTICVFLNNNYFQTEDNQCYIRKFSDLLFKLHYRYSQNNFYWAMQLIGPPDEARTYRFEIDVCDNTNNNQKIFLRSCCAQLTEKNQAFAHAGQYVCLGLAQIRPFLTDQLNYTVRITK